MNFDELKDEMRRAMDQDETDSILPIATISAESKMPIEEVQKTMRSEIRTQLLCIITFFVAPFLLQFVPPMILEPFPMGIYLIFMFLTTMMTLGYLAKMVWFLNRASTVQVGTRETILTFIFDLKLTLEVYKTAIVTGSMLLPISFAAFFMGNGHRAQWLYKCFTLDVSAATLLMLICGYLSTVGLFYYVTTMWAERLYGTHIRTLERLLETWQE